MKSSNGFWSRVACKFPWLFKFSLKKQANKKTTSLSMSVVDKETPLWKPVSLLVPTLIVIIMFTIVPFILNIKFAFFTTKDKLPTSAHVEHFKTLIESPAFAVGFKNSLMYGIIVLPFVIGISLIISSLIASLYRATAKGFWQTIFFLPYITNIVAVSLSFIQFFAPHGMFNSVINKDNYPWLVASETYSLKPLLPMIIQGVWNGLAFNVLIFTTAMLSVDKNQYRSASIDGIGGIKQFFTITLPSIKSTTTFLITMGIIGGVKVFPLALFENKPEQAIANGASTLMLMVYSYTQSGQFAFAAAASILLFVIGITYSFLIRGGFNTVVKFSINLGENNVWNKIKNSEEMIRYQTQKK
ncbi:carbohydrate ABC transporter permease [Mycoplasma sp. Mirounga ES2805-ORL]|uniref:carbohydrate ABC transporter permease n=1 Tax=Mycoplasma sp. Mirounga ES2805-ORL TaxID=754514 RepID=UPI00197C20B3|nr:sugar ABC transporter permease [Mycoplasma sp. Mirounga ES2805-ORL]QSF13885.1 sugar ABC transporter permease [Mycoplasma sp. Mirounga ES2805-ORL]